VKIFRLALIGIAATTFSCATIVSKSEYPVIVKSKPEHVKFSIEKMSTGEKIFEGETPTTVVLKAGDGYFKKSTYSIVFYDENMNPSKNIILQPELDVWYVGNLIFGGLIGILIVDPITGAMWKLPDEVSIDLEALDKSKTSSIHIGKKKLEIVSYYDIPENLRDKLIPYKK